MVRLYAAAAVLVTASLGVLKKGSITFQPSLPQRKLDVIERMGFGVLNKVRASCFKQPSHSGPNQSSLVIDRALYSQSLLPLGTSRHQHNCRLFGEPLIIAITWTWGARSLTGLPCSIVRLMPSVVYLQLAV